MAEILLSWYTVLVDLRAGPRSGNLSRPKRAFVINGRNLTTPRFVDLQCLLVSMYMMYDVERMHGRVWRAVSSTDIRWPTAFVRLAN